MKKSSPARFTALMAFLSFILLICQVAHAQKTIIHCGVLINGIVNTPRENVSIVVENDRIVSIENGFVEGDGENKVIDLQNHTVMPGLMDLHVHLEGETSKNRYIERFTMREADVAYRSTIYAEKTLMAGFTTVRDLGGTGVNISMRNAINEGSVKGPRIFTSGKSIATTGGHADPTNGMKPELMGDPGPREGVVNSPEEGRKAVRQRYKDGADVIKITATGGVLSVAKDGQGPQFTVDEIRAIVETAEDYGMISAAHAHGTEGMKRAVIAGITSIEHGTKMTDEVMDLMIEKGTYYVPTITAGKSVEALAKIPGYYPDVIVPKALEIGPLIQETFGKAYKRGVKIAFGTDAGVFPHGENWKEFMYMVEAGMPPMETIKTATSIAAKLLRIDDELGSIEAGKIADIVATPGNPLEDIKTMENISFVMKEGVVYKHK